MTAAHVTTHGHDATPMRYCDACAEHVMPGHRHADPAYARVTIRVGGQRFDGFRAAGHRAGKATQREAYEAGHADPHGLDSRTEADGSPVRVAETE